MTPGEDPIDAGTRPASTGGGPTACDTAMRMLAFSQARMAAFALFDLTMNDIAWELLLGLFVARERGLKLGIVALCDTIDLPMSVSVRWLRALHASGLVEYDDLPEGGAPRQVRLTPAAEAALRGLIDR